MAPVTVHTWSATEAWRSLQVTFPVRKSEWICAAVLFGCAVVLFVNTALFVDQAKAYAGMAKWAGQGIWKWGLFILSVVRLVVLLINGAWFHSPHARAILAFLSIFAWYHIFTGLLGNFGMGVMLAGGWLVLDAFNFRQALIEANTAEGVKEVMRGDAQPDR